MSTELTTPIKIEIPGIGTIESADLYLKSEVDKVIADLKESHKKEVEQLLIEIVKLKEGAKNLILDNYLKDKQLSHYKYKRCLDKAERCRLEQERIELIECQDITDDDFNKLAKGFYNKWRDRWLKIAEQFKEAK